MLARTLKMIVGCGAILGTYACTTLTGSDPKEDKISHQEIILQKAGVEGNQIDGKERKYWVSVQNSATKPRVQMVASLAIGDANSSEIQARQVLRTRPKDKKALSVLAASLAQKKDFPMAAFYARQLLKQDPDNSLALNIMGLRHLMTTNAMMRDYDMAREYFEKSIQASSEEIAGSLNLAYLQLEIGRPDLAFDSFTTAHERCSGCFHAAIGRGIAASRIGRYETAKSDFEGILAKDKNNGEAIYRLALLRKNGYNDSKGARELLDSLLSADSEATENLKRRAYVLARRLEDSRTIIAEDRVNSAQDESSDDMGSLYQALDDE